MNFLIFLTLSCCCSYGFSSIFKKRIPALSGYDPGPCDTKGHGKVVLIKNRINKDEIVICVEDEDVFQWRSIDSAKNTVGEFFHPGYDCSDILNKRQDAIDGLFWITLGSSKPKLAWCDMTTDGGGWILIGRKNNSITWSVPSNNKTVEPYGDPHWSSSLGNASILDFRVQVATSEDFKATKAHWSFRLQSRRSLKNLMITTDGCDQRSAGVGNIAYVKDLQTDRVVTTNLRCSKFGIAYPSSSFYGWPQLNSCLTKPCPLGFAFHSKLANFRLQLDNSGAFSYSTKQSMSGMERNATAFVGCDNNHCCGCYGPAGGTKDYCTENCQAINGGTVSKHVFTWFWVRSSLPKKAWKKCMDYKVTTTYGKPSWFKFVEGNVVPIEGRCAPNEARIYDGIVVVPDGAAGQKVPPIPGLLQYRKDNDKLYVRSNMSWNVIAEEKKITKKLATYVVELEQKIAELKLQFENLNMSVTDLKQKISGKSCASLYKAGHRHDGVYTINPDGLASFQVWCDMRTDGGGWTVFQRRQDASVDFYRGWKDYKNGFGNLKGNFWLGLEKIHLLTKSGHNNLRVDLMDFNNNKTYAKYGTFSVGSESKFYKLKVGSFSGKAGNSLSLHNGMKFTTKDNDNDSSGKTNCAVSYKGGWWYQRCHGANLNGLYLTASQRSGKGIIWWHWKNDRRSMKKTEMKIRPANF